MRHVLADIKVAEMRGIEIGPLASPAVKKAEGEVYYVDHADRIELQAKYANDSYMRTRLDDIVEVDYVLKPDQSLSDLVGRDAPFDYVIASHLIEHIPDMVGWLAEVASLLSTGGILSLVIPDKRYTFDINRSVTEIGDVIDAHLRHLTRPSSGQIYDFFTKAINGLVICEDAWAGTTDYSNVVRTDVEDPYRLGYSWCQSVLASDDFVDVHCHVFTPESLLDIIDELVRLGLIEFEIASFFPTEHNTLEFHLSLRKLNPSQDPEERLVRQFRSVSRARDILDKDKATRQNDPRADTSDTTTSDQPPSVLLLSDLERKMILAKRRVMGQLRTALAHVRHP
jgi:hypothetical protein